MFRSVVFAAFVTILFAAGPLSGWELGGHRLIGSLVAESLPSEWKEKFDLSPELRGRFFDGIDCAAESKPLEQERERIGECYFAPFESNGIVHSASFDDGAARCVVFENLVEAFRRGDDLQLFFFFGILTRSIAEESAADHDPIVRFIKYDPKMASVFGDLRPCLDPAWLAETPEAFEKVKVHSRSLDLSEKEFINANALMVRLFLWQWTGRDTAASGRDLIWQAAAVARKEPSAVDRLARLWSETLGAAAAESLKAFNAAEKIASDQERAVWYYLHGLYELEINLRDERPIESDVFCVPFVQRPETPRAEYRVVYDSIARKSNGFFDSDSRLCALLVCEALARRGQSVALLDLRTVFSGEIDPACMKLLIVPADSVNDYRWLSARLFFDKLRSYADSGGKILWIGQSLPEALAPLASVHLFCPDGLSPIRLEIDNRTDLPSCSGKLPIGWDDAGCDALFNAVSRVGGNHAYRFGWEPPAVEKKSWDGQTELDFGF